MVNKKIVAVWIGRFAEEDAFYHDYMETKYDAEDNTFSFFRNDAQLDSFDGDFIESWWFEELNLKTLLEYKNGLLDNQFFFEQIELELRKIDLSQFNTITFLFGETKAYGINKLLFNYEGMDGTNKPIKFLTKVEYVV